MHRLILTAAAVVALAVGALAQAPALTINGVTSGVNGAIADAPFGSKLVIAIDDPTNPSGAYALAAAFAHNAKTTGWWLTQAPTYPFLKPWPLVTGIPTSAIEAAFGTDLFPDSSGSPLVRLDANGRALLVYLVPEEDQFPPGFTASVFFQAVTRASTGTLAATNGIEVTIHAATDTGATLTVARGSTDTNVEIGTLTFAGDPGTATYTRDLPGPYDVLDLFQVGFFELIKNEEPSTNRNLTSFESRSRLRTGRYRENLSFTRIAIPAATDTNGRSIPARDLFRVFDRGTNLPGFVVVNQGENPNTPGKRAFPIAGSFLDDPTDSGNPNYYQGDVLIGYDNLHALVGVTPFVNSTPDRVFVIAIDGSEPYLDDAGKPTAIKDVTPVADPPWARAPINAAMASRDKFYFFTSTTLNFTTLGVKGFHWAPLDGSAGPTQLIVDPLRRNNQQFQMLDEDSTMTSVDGSVVAITLTYDNTTEDFYAVRTLTSPSHAVNISAWKDRSKIFTVGLATDGSAEGAISFAGRWVTYCQEGSSPGIQELFLAASDGSFAEDNKRLTAPFSQSAGLKQIRDPIFIGEDDLVFWAGSSSGTFIGDLYRYHLSDGSYTNLTGTSGEISPPYTKVGNINTRGEVFSPSRRFLYFIRANGTSRGGRPAANIVGLDTRTWHIFDLTGSEFSGGWVADLQGSVEPGSPAAETWSFMRAPGALSNLMVFKSAYADTDARSDNVFLFDVENPFAAFPLTNFVDPEALIVNLTPAEFGPFIGLSRGSDEGSQDIDLLDVSHLELKRLEQSRSPQYGAMVFLPPILQGPSAAPGAFAWVSGIAPAKDPNVGVQAHFLALEHGATTATFPGLGGNELVHWLEMHR